MSNDDDAKYQHPSYAANLTLWKKIRDVVEGEEAIKAAGKVYLPKVSDAQSDDEYKAYLERPAFYGATGRTVEGLLGAIFRKPPKIDVPKTCEGLLENADGAGAPIEVLIQRTAAEVLQVARFGLLVDMPDLTGARPDVRIVPYCAESIWDWRVENKTLVHLVLHEIHDKPDAEGYGHVITEQLLVLRLTDGFYTVERLEKRKEQQAGGGMAEKFVSLGAPIKPVVRGKPLKEIPFIFAAPTDLTPEVKKSPIADMVAVNLSHFKSSADYEHGAHFTALPTPWASGLDTDTGKNIALGPSTFLMLPDGAEAGMLEFTGSGLKMIAENLDRKERLLVLLGARLLEDTKQGVEAAETHRIRHSGENSILASIATVTGRAFKRALEIARDWMGTTGDVTCEVNKDFFDTTMSPQMMEALLKSWMSGAISHDTYLYNVKKGELLPDDVSEEDEKERINDGDMPPNLQHQEDALAIKALPKPGEKKDGEDDEK